MEMEQELHNSKASVHLTERRRLCSSTLDNNGQTLTASTNGKRWKCGAASGHKGRHESTIHDDISYELNFSSNSMSGNTDSWITDDRQWDYDMNNRQQQLAIIRQDKKYRTVWEPSVRTFLSFLLTSKRTSGHESPLLSN